MRSGVNPGSTARYFSDWYNIYQTPATPNIKGLPWYNTFGEAARSRRLYPACS